MFHRSVVLPVLLAACAGSEAVVTKGAPPPPPPPQACKHEDSVCIVRGAAEAKFEASAVTSKTDVAGRGKGAPGEVEFVMEVGRASLFVNGRYVATTPLGAPIRMPAGKNDIHIRSGRQRVAKGVLTVPPGQPMRVKVRYR
jgi:hypothetical protein